MRRPTRNCCPPRQRRSPCLTRAGSADEKLECLQPAIWLISSLRGRCCCTICCISVWDRWEVRIRPGCQSKLGGASASRWGWWDGGMDGGARSQGLVSGELSWSSPVACPNRFLCNRVRVWAALQRQRRQRPPSPPAPCHWLFPRRNSAVTADGERPCLDTKPPYRQKWHIAEVSNAAGQTGVRAPAEFLSPPRLLFSIRELRSAY